MKEPLSVTHPGLAAEWSEKNLPLTADQVTYGSHDRVWWKGSCGHEWKTLVNNRTVNHTGCPYCCSRKVLPGFNDLATKAPELAKEWSEKNYPMMPDQVMPRSNKKYWWKCSLGHEWLAKPNSRMKGSGCPYCKHFTLLPGFNDLATEHPELIAEWSDRNLPLRPDMIFATPYRKAWWKCPECGNEYERLVTLRIRGYGCPYCSEVKVNPGQNDLVTRYPDIAAEWDYVKNKTWKPDMVTGRSKNYYWWRCRYGHSWGARVKDRVRENLECPVCRAEFHILFPQMLILLYAERNHLQTVIQMPLGKGITLETSFPEIHAAFETEGLSVFVRNRQEIKRKLCAENGISYYAMRGSNDLAEDVRKVRDILRNHGMEVTGPEEDDITWVKKEFLEAREAVWNERERERMTNERKPEDAPEDDAGAGGRNRSRTGCHQDL